MSPLSLLQPRPGAAKSANPGPAETSPRRLTSPTVFLFVILTAQLMVVLDTTIVNVALPHIQAGLRFSGNWALLGPERLSAHLRRASPAGRPVGDLLGRRRTFLTGIAIFSMSSLLGGFAVTGWMLLAARALQGVGAALAAPSSLALLTTVFSDGPQRVRAIGLFTTVSAAGGAIGLVAGGVLTQLVSWRWVMFVNVPIGITVWAVGRVALQETDGRHGHFDVAGALASTLGMGAIVLGLVEASTDGWASPVTLGALGVGALLLGVFVRVETRAQEPILPLRLLANGTRTAANVSRGLMYAGMFGMFFFLGQFLQDVEGYSPLRTGIDFLPIPVSVFLASQLVSKGLVNRIRPKVLMLSGIGMTIVSLLLATQLHAGTSYPRVLITLVLLGLGSGTALVPLTTASLSGVEPGDAGAASGLVNVIQQVGAALGLAVLVTVLTAAAGHSQLGAGVGARASLVHGLDVAFGAGALFGLVALIMVATLVHLPAASAAAAAEGAADALGEVADGEEAELVDGEGFAWADPELVA